MPHVIVKLWPGKSAAQKQQLADAIVREVARTMDYGPEAVSVGLEEVAPDDWMTRVYAPDIQGKRDTLTKMPGYGPLATRAD
ncbi:tautomerase family protein [Sphingomonas pituitosa]|uniref:tautomerase family protein n=1 Tax=Sphingomonas pituitosa TaxID=99597 RepID=UPI00082B9246|nr:tautomerase family protein [Sphingomonas pituitosa]